MVLKRFSRRRSRRRQRPGCDSRRAAINQDGRSNGLTAPSGPAQTRSCYAALSPPPASRPRESATSRPTGPDTVLGDPIEVSALKAALLRRPPSGPALLARLGEDEYRPPRGGGRNRWSDQGRAGSRKSRIAAQSAPPDAQLAPRPGRHSAGRVHAAAPLDGDELPAGGRGQLLRLRRHQRSRRPRRSAARLAGTAEFPRHLLVLSARSQQALLDLAAAYDARLGEIPDAQMPDVCFTSMTGRRHFDHRLAVEAGSRAECREGLRAFAARALGHASVSVGHAGAVRPKIAFLFSGLDSLCGRAGRALYDEAPVFRNVLEQCDEILRSVLERPLLQVLFGGADDQNGPPFEETACAGPALFALQCAFLELWRSWGIVPDAVLGHGLGEYAAALAAGVFGLEDGLKLVAARARLFQGLPPGEMWAVGLGPSRAARVIRCFEHQVSVAAINAPAVSVLSGEHSAVRAAVERMRAAGASVRRLNVDRGSNSPQVDSIRGPFEAVARGFAFAKPAIPFIANVTGEPHEAGIVGPAYWGRQMREPVRFQAGIRSLRRLGCSVFLELGPAPDLIALSRPGNGGDETARLPSLHPGTTDWQVLLRSLGELYVRGAPVDSRTFNRGQRRRVVLPTYPFERRRYWFTSDDEEPRALPHQNGHAVDSVTSLIERGDAEGLARRVSLNAGLLPDQFEVLAACMRALVDDHRHDSSGVSPGDLSSRPPEGLVTRNGHIEAPTVFDDGSLGRRLQEAAPEDRFGLMASFIQGEVAAILKLRPGRTAEPHKGFFDMGMDSLMALDLKKRLEAALGRSLPATLAFESPTIETLAARLVELCAPPAHKPLADPDDVVAISRDQSLDEVLCLTDMELELLIEQEFQRAVS